MESSMRVTLDTGADLPNEVLGRLEVRGFRFSQATVSERETRGTSFHETTRSIATVPEEAVWDESEWGVGVWGEPEGNDRLETVLRVISNGSFPPPGARARLSEGQRHQLRDAMVFCAHVREKHDLFVTSDQTAFIGHGRRELLEAAFATRILTTDEFTAAHDRPDAT